MREILIAGAVAVLLVSVSRAKTEVSKPIELQGFNKECEYHIDEVVEGIDTKRYVWAYLHSVLVYKFCRAFTEEEEVILDKIHEVRNKLMEEY